MKTFSKYLTEAFRSSGYILNGLDYNKLSKENLTSILNAIKENKKRYINDANNIKKLLNSIPLKFSSPREISKLQPLYDALRKLPNRHVYYGAYRSAGIKDESKLFNNGVYYSGTRRDVYSKSDSCETIVNATNDKWKFFFAKCYEKGMKTDEIVELKNLIVSVCKEFMNFPTDYELEMYLPDPNDIVQAIFKGSGYITKKRSVFSNTFFEEARISKKMYVDDPKKAKPTFLYGTDIYYGTGLFSSFFVKGNTFHDVADKKIGHLFTGVYKAVIDMETGIPETINYGMMIRKGNPPSNRYYEPGRLNPATNTFASGITDVDPDELKKVFNLNGSFVPYTESFYNKQKTEIIHLKI